MDADTRSILTELQKAQNSRPSRGAPNNRLLDGMSTSLTRKLDTMSRQELIDLKERNEKLFANSNLMSTLPDKGAKLRTSIEQINALLQKQDIAKGMSELSINPSPDMRKRSVDQANDLADKRDASNSLLAAKTMGSQSKTRMMRMDESIKLEQAQQQQIKVI
ncbi:hypothetical protein BDB00DRAFT_384272 [Zychaea mexicana]|uniref:uncharacterized protein n=1 Tax=Zychaea mexicana TaxID=64656 RepID=UPI0022FE2456|nr:uncharacterized protein BDB00DRAFT_384272 [Zychaea mexicana]KAI9493093.1 hypothetical protein BDB00DRAFT_384272 [Zychaea mexicana]